VAQNKKQSGASAKSGGGGNKTFFLIAGVIAAAGVGWLLTAGGGAAAGPLPTPAEFEALAAEVTADASKGIPLGSPDAPILIEEFVDYSCPACARFAGFPGKLIRQNYVETNNLEGGGGGPVRWILHDYVLGTFPNSVPAAMAARCAGEQGRYWPLHDLLFARQTRWYTSSSPEDEFSRAAEDVGLDMGSYGECMGESRYLNDIASSRAYGTSRGVGSTPTVFLDGQLLNLAGTSPYEYIEGLIQERLAAIAGSDETPGSDDDADSPE